MSTGLSTTKLTLKEASDLYESGKHRRYGLLFSVNGGAFAVAKLLTGEPGKSSGLVLGGLTLTQLAIGMALFTAVMTADIYFFGEKMRLGYKDAKFFGPPGKVVLILLGVLVCIGWYLVGGPCVASSLSALR
jgi:hypothetical protein